MNITEVIKWLDERKERADIEGLENITTQFVFKDGRSFHSDKGEDYLFALYANYPTLRNAALEAERYKRAGKILEDYMMSGTLSDDDCAALSLYRQAVE